MPKAARLDRIPCQVISFDLVHDLPILRFNEYRSLSDAVELHEFAFVSGADKSVIEHVSESVCVCEREKSPSSPIFCQQASMILIIESYLAILFYEFLALHS